MSQPIIYEQPINERIRSFLRLHTLFAQFHFHQNQSSPWNHTIAIESINEILTFTTRSDIKLEALKELERQHIKLESFLKRPNIDHDQLTQLLDRQSQAIETLQSISGQLGQDLQGLELLNNYKQKSSVPGCVCDFDMPSLKFWLSKPDTDRRSDLDQWFNSFTKLEQGINLILDVIRQSASESEEIAEAGFYQQSLDPSQSSQLLRIKISEDRDYYPEISAGKQRFSIRFLRNPNPESRPDQCEDDIRFFLSVCSI